MAITTEFRKVELQAPADLTYLEANVKHAARLKIDKALPPSAAPEGEDKLRRRVEELVDEVRYPQSGSSPESWVLTITVHSKYFCRCKAEYQRQWH